MLESNNRRIRRLSCVEDMGVESKVVDVVINVCVNVGVVDDVL